MRGKALGAAAPPPPWRITPAYAGKSYPGLFPRISARDHPRICGEKNLRYNPYTEEIGITPAYAGKSKRFPPGSWSGIGSPPHMRGKAIIAPPTSRGSRDHPRICGEKQGSASIQTRYAGSPPHMRGKGTEFLDAVSPRRITPAYAGKRPGTCFDSARLQDHPRICGEKMFALTPTNSRAGSPPHMRGKGTGVAAAKRRGRITPAYAGKSYPLFPG